MLTVRCICLVLPLRADHCVVQLDEAQDRSVKMSVSRSKHTREDLAALQDQVDVTQRKVCDLECGAAQVHKSHPPFGTSCRLITCWSTKRKRTVRPRMWSVFKLKCRACTKPFVHRKAPFTARCDYAMPFLKLCPRCCTKAFLMSTGISWSPYVVWKRRARLHNSV